MNRTNISVIDEELWKWAKKKAIDQDLKGVSEYVFLLLKKEHEKEKKKNAE